MSGTPGIEATAEGVILDVKAVPGGSRDAVAGWLGEALKVKVSAPAEGGKANKAICALLAGRLGVSKGRVAVVAGAGTPRKRIEVRGIDAATAAERLGS